MNDYTKLAALFIISLGVLFIIIGVTITVLFNIPTIMAIGIVLVGIFLILIPFTRERYQ